MRQLLAWVVLVVIFDGVACVGLRAVLEPQVSEAHVTPVAPATLTPNEAVVRCAQARDAATKEQNMPESQREDLVSFACATPQSSGRSDATQVAQAAGRKLDRAACGRALENAAGPQPRTPDELNDLERQVCDISDPQRDGN